MRPPPRGRVVLLATREDAQPLTLMVESAASAAVVLMFFCLGPMYRRDQPQWISALGERLSGVAQCRWKVFGFEVGMFTDDVLDAHSPS